MAAKTDKSKDFNDIEAHLQVVYEIADKNSRVSIFCLVQESNPEDAGVHTSTMMQHSRRNPPHAVFLEECCNMLTRVLTEGSTEKDELVVDYLMGLVGERHGKAASH